MDGPPAPVTPARSPTHANAFTLVATVGALLVCVRHSGVLLGSDEPTSWLGRTPSTGLALLLATSGWLLVMAWERDPRVGPYALRRVLRVWPSLLVVLLVTALLVGPIVSTLPWREYLAHPGTLGYVADNLVLRMRYALPGVFVDNPYPGAVNGSLWSLPAQILCFAIVPLVGLLPARGRWAAWVALATCAAVVLASRIATDVVVWAAPVEQSTIPIAAFAIGAAAAAARLRIPAWAGVLALVLAALSPLAPLGAPRDVALPMLLGVAAVGIGLVDHPVLRRITPRRTLSLGIFLLGFPVQQTLLWLLPSLPALVSLLLALAVTVAGALLLDLVVERPVQALLRRVVPRPRGTGDGDGAPFPGRVPRSHSIG